MELLERFAAGDLEAFEVLFRQHQREVYAWIVRIVRDSGIAEDLTVETFWRIYKYRARFKPVRKFSSLGPPDRHQRSSGSSKARAPRNPAHRGRPLRSRRGSRGPPGSSRSNSKRFS